MATQISPEVRPGTPAQAMRPINDAKRENSPVSPALERVRRAVTPTFTIMKCAELRRNSLSPLPFKNLKNIDTVQKREDSPVSPALERVKSAATPTDTVMDCAALRPNSLSPLPFKNLKNIEG